VDSLEGDIGGEQEKLDRDQLLRTLLGRVREKRQPVKRQTITRLANPSITESSPNEMSAIDPASTPAVIAIAPSAPIQASESQESWRALLAAACHSGARADALVATTGTRGPSCSLDGCPLDVEHGLQQGPACTRECVQDHLPLAAGVDETGVA
jgi:hypothetical protein